MITTASTADAIGRLSPAHLWRGLVEEVANSCPQRASQDERRPEQEHRETFVAK